MVIYWVTQNATVFHIYLCRKIVTVPSRPEAWLVPELQDSWEMPVPLKGQETQGDFLFC